MESEKEKFFSNINTSDITDSKTFWKTVKPFFADKIKPESKITDIEKNCLPGRSRGNSFRKNNYRRSSCSTSFSSILIQTRKYLLIMVMIMISSALMTKLKTLSIILGIIQLSL